MIRCWGNAMSGWYRQGSNFQDVVVEVVSSVLARHKEWCHERIQLLKTDSACNTKHIMETHSHPALPIGSSHPIR